ncbi:MAG: hypothetical protein AAGK38_09615 [Pseudomonadota bacterium]
MKFALLATAMFFVGLTPALANTCKERFVALLKDRSAEEPVKILITQQIKNGPKTVNWSYQDRKGNWLTEMVEPANAPWSMGRENVLYTSNDKGRSWTKVRDMVDQSAANAKALEERAATVEGAVCGEADVDGKPYKTVEASSKMLGSFKGELHEKFWLEAQSGTVARLEMTMKGTGFESHTVQEIEPAPQFVMPTP